MIIRARQMAILRDQFLASMSIRLAKRLVAEFPERGFQIDQVARTASELIEDVAPLGITGGESNYRLLRFHVLAEPLLASSATRSVVLRILHIVAWPPDKRLNFLEREILGRVQPRPDATRVG